MSKKRIGRHVVDYSHERRAHVLRYLRGTEALDSGLGDDAIVLLTVGTLICDRSGHVPETQLKSAMQDASAVNYARQLIAEAGVA